MVETTIQLNNVTSAAVTQLNSDKSHIAVSTDGTTPTVSDTSLGGTELIEAVFNSSTTSNSVSKSMFLDVTEFNSNIILKAGTYNALSGGDLLSANLTNSIVKNSSTEVFIEIKTTVNAVNV